MAPWPWVTLIDSRAIRPMSLGLKRLKNVSELKKRPDEHVGGTFLKVDQGEVLQNAHQRIQPNFLELRGKLQLKKLHHFEAKTLCYLQIN